MTNAEIIKLAASNYLRGVAENVGQVIVAQWKSKIRAGGDADGRFPELWANNDAAVASASLGSRSGKSQRSLTTKRANAEKALRKAAESGDVRKI